MDDGEIESLIGNSPPTPLFSEREGRRVILKANRKRGVSCRASRRTRCLAPVAYCLFPRALLGVSLFGTGMGLIIDLPDLILGKMGINLGGGDIGVAQHLLDGTEISPVFQQMSGKRMP